MSKDLNNEKNECDILSGDDEKLRQMLHGLKKVEAPKDFDFRLKSRFSKAKQNESQTQIWQRLRFVVPALLAVLIIAVIAFNTNIFRQTDVPQVADKRPENSFEKESQANADVLSEKNKLLADKKEADEMSNSLNQNSLKPDDRHNQIALRQHKKPAKKEIRKQKSTDNFNGSIVLSVNSNVPNFKPKGTEQNQIPQKPQDFDNENSYSVQEVFSQIGVEAILDEKNWIVRSVIKNSLAERSGVRQNDVIEAIDETQILPETKFKKNFEGKNLKIKRDGKQMELKLQNK